jgi:prepilin-type N-terminal cleavage/methylation domain-containing protein
MKKDLMRGIRRGFTLVEVLVAMVILVLIIGAVTLIESKNINFSASSKFQTQANGVATEGLNIVKSIADQNKLGVSLGGECSDPSDTSKCPTGSYYIDGSNQLKTCVPNGQSPCPGGNVTVNGKVFNRTIVVP